MTKDWRIWEEYSEDFFVDNSLMFLDLNTEIYVSSHGEKWQMSNGYYTSKEGTIGIEYIYHVKEDITNLVLDIFIEGKIFRKSLKSRKRKLSEQGIMRLCRNYQKEMLYYKCDECKEKFKTKFNTGYRKKRRKVSRNVYCEKCIEKDPLNGFIVDEVGK